MEIIVRHGYSDFEHFDQDSSMKDVLDSIHRAIVKEDAELSHPSPHAKVTVQVIDGRPVAFDEEGNTWDEEGNLVPFINTKV